MRYYVYFLLQDLKPVYIGSTSDLHTRMRGHKDKMHNAIRVFRCKDKDTALHYEKRWQLRFKPVYNKNGTKGKTVRMKVVKGTGEPRFKYKAKNVWVQFPVDYEMLEMIKRFAKEQDRTVGNYISYSLHRAIKNDTFILEDLFEKSKIRKISNG